VKSLQNPVMDVAIGSNFCCILDRYGNVYALGDNSAGQLGIGQVQESRKPVLIEFLKEKKIRKIFAGHDFTFALGEDITITSFLSSRTRKSKEYINTKIYHTETNQQKNNIDRYLKTNSEKLQEDDE
jgi:alpha-tubulin suppressor-like RCC1 family protein